MASSSKQLAVNDGAAAARQLLVLGFTKNEVRALAESPRLAELSSILDLARQAYGPRAAEWLLMPEERLGNVLPATLLRDPHNGPNLVKQVLLNSLRGTIA